MKRDGRRFPSVLGVIPARYGSVRLPGKPLALIKGRPMVQWVYTAARSVLPNVLVATDDRRVMDVVHGFGGRALMTPKSCSSGTARMAWVAKRIKAAYYVNIQGDEPMMKAAAIRKAVGLAIKMKSIATVATRLEHKDEGNPNAVKVVVGKDGRALYFSRSLIPFPRDGGAVKAMKHLGLYVYPRRELFRFVSQRPTDLENIEKLEQLRALYYGQAIYVALTKYDSVGVDTKADLIAVEKQLK